MEKKMILDRTFEETKQISAKLNHSRAVLNQIYIKHIPDEDPDLSFLETDYQEDRKRLKNYGESWNMIGIKAYCTIYIPFGNGSYFLIQTLESGGLWGIESDSSKEYLEEIEKEQIEELREIMNKLFILQA